ncbi:acyl-CoA-binding protein [Foetidibacter luteolus]|uniref:acyl-CoA-binding protein n=1 Tax=Foetidibacter luteolus TaxID=2608880 RepID=UPI00129BBCBD|nr:acyl-CoA-binding protein [Foetidibacter luteolus]
MMELKALFEKAAGESKQLSQKPSNEILLQLYSLYKQATEGDATEDNEPTNPFDFIAKAKFSAWQGVKGKTKDEAMREYIALVEKLK